MQSDLYFEQQFIENEYQPPFIDKTRIKIVEGITSVFDDVVKESTPHIVSIEAPTGFGKTRIITEFYKKLSLSQTSKYWPEQLLDSLISENKDIAISRKVIFPPLSKLTSRIDQSLPDFMWWGINCQSVNGVPIESLYESLSQFDAHKDYLEEAWGKHQSVFERVKDKVGYKSSAINTAEEGFNFGVGAAVQELTGAVVPFLGLATKLGQWGIGEVSNNHHKKKKLNASGVFSVESRQEDLLDELTALIGKLAIPKLPLIIVIEDLHNAHHSIISMLETILKSNSSILILATSIKGSESANKNLDSLLTSELAKNRITKIVNGQIIDDARFGVGTRFDELSESSLREVIKFYYSHTDDSVCNKLISKHQNPLILEMICNTGKLCQKFKKNGKLELLDSELDSLPSDLKGIYLNAWNELTDHEKSYITLCSLAVPQDNLTWHNELVSKAGLNISEGVERKGKLPHSWVSDLFVGSQLKKFNEYINFQITQEFVSECFSEIYIEQFYSSLHQTLSEYDLSEVTKENVELSYLIIHLHKKENVKDDLLLKAIQVLQKEYSYRPDGCEYRLELGKKLKYLSLDTITESYIYSLLDYTNDLKNNGNYNDAIDTLEFVIKSLSSQSGFDSELYFIVKNNILHLKALRNKGDFGERDKLEGLRSLKNEASLVLGENHPLVIDIYTHIYNSCDVKTSSGNEIKEIESFILRHEAVLKVENVLHLKTTLLTLKYNLGQLSGDKYLDTLRSTYKESYEEECYEIMITVGTVLGFELYERDLYGEAIHIFEESESISAQIFGQYSYECSVIRLHRAELNIDSGCINDAIVELNIVQDFLLSNAIGNSKFENYDGYIALVQKIIPLFYKADLHKEIDLLVSGIKKIGVNIKPEVVESLINNKKDMEFNKELLNYMLEQNIQIESNDVLRKNSKNNTLDFLELILKCCKDKAIFDTALKLIVIVEDRYLKYQHCDVFHFRYLKSCLYSDFHFYDDSILQLNTLISDRLKHFGHLDENTLNLIVNLAFDYWDSGSKEKAIESILQVISEEAKSIDEKLYFKNCIRLVSWYQHSELEDLAINLARELLKDIKVREYRSIAFDAKELLGYCYIDRNEISRGIKILKGLLIELIDDRDENSDRIQKVSSRILRLEGGESITISTQKKASTNKKRKRVKKNHGKNKR